MTRYGRIIPILISVLLLVSLLGACGEGILPPKETAAVTPTPMPTPTPTPTPTPFSGEIASIEILQAWDEEGALFNTEAFVERRDTAVYVYLTAPLGHRPDERDSLAIGRGSEIVGVYAADESSTEDCLHFFFTGEEAAALEAGDYTFSALIDGAQFSRRAELKSTRALSVLLVPVLGSFAGATSYPTEGWQAALEQLQREFPLSRDGLAIVTAPGLTLSAEGYDLRTGDGLVRAWEALRERAGLLNGYDLIFGFVSGGMGEKGELGCFGRDGVALIDTASETFSETFCSFAAQALGSPAHEQGAIRWQTLHALLSAARTMPDQTETLHVSGLISPDGTAAIRPLYTGPGYGAGRTATPLDGSGSYALVFGDGDGTVLRRDAFTPDFVWQTDGGPMLSAAPVELLVSIPAGATTVRVVGPVPVSAGGGDAEDGEDSGETEQTEADDASPYTEGELFFAELPAEPYESSYASVPNTESLRSTARVEWETELTRPLPESEVTEEEEEEEKTDEEEPPAPVLPDPYYELYMCYDGLQLLVYRGGLRFAELDMPSLPKPEQFSFRLLTCGGRTSTVAESPVLSMN